MRFSASVDAHLRIRGQRFRTIGGRAGARPYRRSGTADDQLGGEHFSLSSSATTESFQHEIDGETAHCFHWLADHGQRWIDLARPTTIVAWYARKVVTPLDS